MAPAYEKSGVFAEQLARSAGAAVVAAGPEVARLATRHVLIPRALLVESDAQKVTLGIIAVYVVVIALLWNLPYVRWSLWPFKVGWLPHPGGFVGACSRPSPLAL